MKYFKAHIFFLFVAFAGIASLISVKTASAGTPSVKLSDSSAAMTQTSETEWTLEKTGELDIANNTVTWTITATEGQTVEGILVINGQMTVTNGGNGPATIGTSSSTCRSGYPRGGQG